MDASDPLIGVTNPRPWRTLDPRDAIKEPDGWAIIDAAGETVAVLSHGNYESDKAAAELIVRLVNAESAR